MRERNQGAGKELLICGICHGCYDKGYIWSHKKRCRSTSSTNVPLPVALVETSAVSEDFKCQILSHFRNYAVGRICQNDHTTLLVVEKLFAKLHKKPDKKTEVKRSIMADMRKLGNLYLKFSQQNPQTLGSHLTRYAGTLETFRHSRKQSQRTQLAMTDLKAGLKASLYYLLKTMAKIVKGTFIVNHEYDKATEIDKLVVVLELNHASVFVDATYKINLSQQTKLRRPQNLPVDEDVAKVREYKVRTIESLTSSHDELSCANFILLRDLAVCRLTLFNFRRGGEPARLRIADWVDAQNDVWLDNTRIKKMHSVEQELFSLQGTCWLIKKKPWVIRGLLRSPLSTNWNIIVQKYCQMLFLTGTHYQRKRRRIYPVWTTYFATCMPLITGFADDSGQWRRDHGQLGTETLRVFQNKNGEYSWSHSDSAVQRSPVSSVQGKDQCRKELMTRLSKW